MLHYRFVLACVVLIPYERTCIEVPASLQVLVSLVADACCITGSCLAGACWCGTDTLRTNLYRSACCCLLYYRFLLVGVVLIHYERTCIEVLAGACCCLLHYRFVLADAWFFCPWLVMLVASLQVRACLCGTDTLRTNLYRSTCFITGSCVLGC